MRILQLQSPFMTGADVADWQRFLATRGLFASPADGVFGAMAAEATRDFQSQAGLIADGVVGPNTLKQATADGFLETGASASTPSSSSTSSTPAAAAAAGAAGMDTMVNCAAFAAQLAQAGMKFVIRYYSRDGSKNLTPAEARALSAAGLDLVVVYEDGATIDTFSAQRGASDAQQALLLASTTRQPAGSAIYFAVDFDATQEQINGPIMAYLGAVKQALASAAISYRLGVYGSGLSCRLLQQAGLAAYTWLSGAPAYQETKSFRTQAHLVQFPTSRALLPGLNIDDDVAQSADFGSFQVAPASPAT